MSVITQTILMILLAVFIFGVLYIGLIRWVFRINELLQILYEIRDQLAGINQKMYDNQ